MIASQHRLSETINFFGGGQSPELCSEFLTICEAPPLIHDFILADLESAGIEGIEADDSNAPVEYFNLNCMRVRGEALSPGLYIKRQGSKTTKMLVK